MSVVHATKRFLETLRRPRLDRDLVSPGHEAACTGENLLGQPQYYAAAEHAAHFRTHQMAVVWPTCPACLVLVDVALGAERAGSGKVVLPIEGSRHAD